MAYSNKRKLSGVNGIRLAAVTMEVATALAPVVHEIIVRLPIPEPSKKLQKELVELPPLYSKGESLNLNQAVEILKDYDLRPKPIQLHIRDAKVEYRDCFDFQVVDAKFMRRQKVDAELPIIIRYITQEVIDESRRLYEETHKVHLKHHNKRRGRNSHDI